MLERAPAGRFNNQTDLRFALWKNSCDHRFLALDGPAGDDLPTSLIVGGESRNKIVFSTGLYTGAESEPVRFREPI
jgi:hypothetical protein